MDELSAMRIVVVALLFGAVTLWLLARQRAASVIAQAQAEATQLRERLQAAEQALDGAQAAHRALQQQATGWRDALDAASNEQARLAERSLRVPALESELGRLADDYRAAVDEVRRLTAVEGRLGAELGAERQSIAMHRSELADTRAALIAAEARGAAVADELTELRTRSDAERQHADEKLALLLSAKESLTDQFKSLAADILEDKSKRFAEQNQTNLGQLLEPLRLRLGEFQGKVEEVYVQEGKDRSALAAQVRQLMDLNQALSQDAKNLTQALKGSAKTQGNWGELILERVLEASGLSKGREYHVQDHRVREDGTRAQPDVVIDLPEERRLVIDSKVSLVAYERYVSAETDELRTAALRQHVESVRAHIRSLSDKRYQELYGRSLDFVLAFVPIEPAFMMAITHDAELCMDAWRRNVLLVSPSTLLFVVRTVAHLWRQEAQSRNAQEIAKRGAELYDKLSGFVDDLQAVGQRIGQAQKAYEAAHGKLATGRGNVIRQAELLRDLGVKPAKALPAAMVEAASEGDDDGILLTTLIEQPALETEARKAA